jgi:hypothetical protein
MSVPDGARECQSEPGVVQAGYKRNELLVYQYGHADFIAMDARSLYSLDWWRI